MYVYIGMDIAEKIFRESGRCKSGKAAANLFWENRKINGTFLFSELNGSDDLKTPESFLINFSYSFLL